MEPTKSTLLADGSLSEQTFETPSVTLGYSRKLSDGNYGGQEASLYYQVEIPLGSTEQEKAALIEQGYALVRNMVNMQLEGAAPARPSTLPAQTPTEQRIAEELGGEIVSIQQKRKQAPRKKIGDKRHLWEDLRDNPNDWWDNRKTKRNPLGPDFKHKTTDEALWWDSKPEDIIL